MLILLLKIIIFATATLWSFLTRLVFSSLAYSLVLLIKAFRLPGEATHGGFQQIAETIRACFEFIFGMILQAVSYIIETIFDLLKDSITGSIAVAGSVAGGFAEKLKTSFDETLKKLPDLLEEFSDMISNMVTDLWNNYKEAVGYVTENAQN